MAYFAEDDMDPHMLSDDEHEQADELEAISHLPPEERRKSLRRLRNRESARRVRARRLAEMSQMEGQLKGVHDENDALKAHVSQLQAHIQAMTVKIYEVTSKYEAAVAENIRLKAELKGQGPAMVPLLGEYMPGPMDRSTSSPMLPASQQQQQGAQPQGPAGGTPADVGSQGMSQPHANLRSSNPAPNVHNQRQAIEEVVMLLQEHRRRSEVVKQGHGCGSDHASSINNMALHPAASAGSPLSEGPAAPNAPATSVGCGAPQGRAPGRGSLDLGVGADAKIKADMSQAGYAQNAVASNSEPLPCLQHVAFPAPAMQQQLLHQQHAVAAQQQAQQAASVFGLHGHSTGASNAIMSAPYFSAVSMAGDFGGFGQHQQQGSGGAGPMAMAPRSASFAAGPGPQQQQQSLHDGGGHGNGAHMTWPGIFIGNAKDDVFMDFDDLVMPQDL